MRTLLLALLVAAPVAAAIAIPEHFVQDDHARLSMPQRDHAWPLAPAAAPVCFTFENLAHRPVYLPSSAPWRILDAKGEVVYAPLALTYVDVVEPGGTRTACWGGLDMVDSRQPVVAGQYAVAWDFFPDMHGPMRTLSLPFALRDPLVHHAG